MRVGIGDNGIQCPTEENKRAFSSIIAYSKLY